MLSHTIQKTVELPDASASATIRKLSHYQLSIAEDRIFDVAAEKLKKIGDVKLPDKAADPGAPVDIQKPENKYDRRTVLEYGIVNWTYPTLDAAYGPGRGRWPSELDHVALCDRMGISYMDLISDELPAYVVADYGMVMRAEHKAKEKERRDAERKRR